ncbi:C40 family peptidase [Kutzneria buriramensis]|uniref:Cell wall-associated NlpC family hydrolase n=1 Tax=Kutzneria buriramensis TaxID=1045776 RepID=A0A3E0H002_9PSEU|nr:C40 family peptidase [Kutzneria buriramensis]REH35747.1 cell wall-associated NlpC family hydrolase [Kutzneria buriramensis]
MSGTTKIAVLAAVILAVPVVLVAVAVAGVATMFGGGGAYCATTGSANTAAVGLRPDQMTNAVTIVAVGKQLSVPPQGWIVAIAAALQESSLVNLDHGDQDSLGLFQQRPSQGSGTPTQIMNPTYAATQFYRHLLAVPSWQQMSVNDAAQAVERSAFPDAYAQHEQAARQIVAALAGGTCTGVTTGTGDCEHIQAPNAAALAAVNYACGQRGLPYVWGGNGAQDGGFDCSGLTKAAYAAAGISLPRTAQTQYDAGPRVPAGQPLLPGDLVFFGTPSNVHHVGLYIGGGLMIDAPDFGQHVKSEPYTETGFLGATRPAGTTRG